MRLTQDEANVLASLMCVSGACQKVCENATEMAEAMGVLAENHPSLRQEIGMLLQATGTYQDECLKTLLFCSNRIAQTLQFEIEKPHNQQEGNN